MGAMRQLILGVALDRDCVGGGPGFALAQVYGGADGVLGERGLGGGAVRDAKIKRGGYGFDADGADAGVPGGVGAASVGQPEQAAWQGLLVP